MSGEGISKSNVAASFSVPVCRVHCVQSTQVFTLLTLNGIRLHAIALQSHVIAFYFAKSDRITSHGPALHGISSHCIKSNAIRCHCSPFLASHHIEWHHIASHRVTSHRMKLLLHRTVFHEMDRFAWVCFALLFLFLIFRSNMRANKWTGSIATTNKTEIISQQQQLISVICPCPSLSLNKLVAVIFFV